MSNPPPIDFTPLSGQLTPEDKAAYIPKPSLATYLVGYPFFVGMFVIVWGGLAILVKELGVAGFESGATWLISFGIALGLAYMLMKHSQRMRAYELRLRKFAAINNFTYTDKTTRDGRSISDKKAAEVIAERFHRSPEGKKIRYACGNGAV
jgi:hypothetical protein